MQYFYVSTVSLTPGTLLVGRRYTDHDDHILLVARESIALGEGALRLLNLVDDLIRYSRRVEGEAWPEPVHFSAVVDEVILEKVRADGYPDRPSRIGGIFLFLQRGDAERFQAEQRHGGGVILECSTDSKVFEADMGLIKNPNFHHDVGAELASAETRAHAYWQGAAGNGDPIEGLALGPVRVDGPSKT